MNNRSAVAVTEVPCDGVVDLVHQLAELLDRRGVDDRHALGGVRPDEADRGGDQRETDREGDPPKHEHRGNGHRQRELLEHSREEEQVEQYEGDADQPDEI